jgi:hypothetical protein
VEDERPEITRAIERFAFSLATLPDDALVEPWPEQVPAGERWHAYDFDARNVAFLINLKLCALASEIGASRPSRSRAASIAAQHHAAYRDLTGALAGVREDEFDRVPAPGEWPLRAVVHHVVGAEMGFSLLIRWAVERRRADDDRPITMPREEMEPHYATVSDEGSMAEVMGRSDDLHWRVVNEFSQFGDGDLEALNVWWEGYEIPVWFRMHRFDAHLREHTIQVDKTLAAIGQPPSEPERLARLLHQSLGAVESVLIGAPDSARRRADELAAEVREFSRHLAGSG